MERARMLAQAVATVLVAAGLLVLALAFTGTGPDWMMRCGGRYFRHACGEGELPMQAVIFGVLLLIGGLVLSTGEIYVRRGRIQLGRNGKILD